MNKQANHKQKGVALLLMLLVIFSIGSTVFLAGFDSNASNLRQETDIREEMLLAKEALLAYSFSYADNNTMSYGPGRLPCPNPDNPSGSDNEPDCSIVNNAIGRLPEKEIFTNIPFEISDRFANIDRQFWYLPSSNYRSDALLLNSSSPSSFSLDGNNDIVAVIISPGEELRTPTLTQYRQSDPTLAANYLEGGNEVNNLSFFSSANTPANFNDHVLTITRSEIMSLAVVRVAQSVKSRLDNFHSILSPSQSSSDPLSNSYPHSINIESCFNWFGTVICFPPTGTTPALNGFIDAMTDTTAIPPPPTWFDTDNWDNESTYTFINADEATFSFANCDITFTLKFGSKIEMNQRSC